jgi:D-alanine--poly(phosphoribitol) ligase subunit 2
VRHDLDLRLFDLQILDSMKTVELIVAFSEAFGIGISPADLEREQWKTPRAIVADIERRIGA